MPIQSACAVDTAIRKKLAKQCVKKPALERLAHKIEEIASEPCEPL